MIFKLIRSTLIHPWKPSSGAIALWALLGCSEIPIQNAQLQKSLSQCGIRTPTPTDSSPIFKSYLPMSINTEKGHLKITNDDLLLVQDLNGIKHKISFKYLWSHNQYLYGYHSIFSSKMDSVDTNQIQRMSVITEFAKFKSQEICSYHPVDPIVQAKNLQFLRKKHLYATASTGIGSPFGHALGLNVQSLKYGLDFNYGTSLRGNKYGLGLYHYARPFYIGLAASYSPRLDTAHFAYDFGWAEIRVAPSLALFPRLGTELNENGFFLRWSIGYGIAAWGTNYQTLSSGSFFDTTYTISHSAPLHEWMISMTGLEISASLGWALF